MLIRAIVLNYVRKRQLFFKKNIRSSLFVTYLYNLKVFHNSQFIIQF